MSEVSNIEAAPHSSTIFVISSIPCASLCDVSCSGDLWRQVNVVRNGINSGRMLSHLSGQKTIFWLAPTKLTTTKQTNHSATNQRQSHSPFLQIIKLPHYTLWRQPHSTNSQPSILPSFLSSHILPNSGHWANWHTHLATWNNLPPSTFRIGYSLANSADKLSSSTASTSNMYVSTYSMAYNS